MPDEFPPIADPTATAPPTLPKQKLRLNSDGIVWAMGFGVGIMVLLTYLGDAYKETRGKLAQMSASNFKEIAFISFVLILLIVLPLFHNPIQTFFSRLFHQKRP